MRQRQTEPQGQESKGTHVTLTSFCHATAYSRRRPNGSHHISLSPRPSTGHITFPPEPKRGRYVTNETIDQQRSLPADVHAPPTIATVGKELPRHLQVVPSASEHFSRSYGRARPCGSDIFGGSLQLYSHACARTGSGAGQGAKDAGVTPRLDRRVGSARLML